MDYNLTGLGEREFEHLAQALALRELGPGVQVFGDGPDGGREAAFEGKFNLADRSGQASWTGYGIMQAKFHRRPQDTDRDTKWLLAQLRTELVKWSDSRSRRVRRGRIPRYVIFVTNVVLSGVPQHGGIDAADSLISEYAETLGLEGWDVWHHDKICRLLDAHDGVRRTYGGFVIPGDVLAHLSDFAAGSSSAQLGDALTTHAAKELLTDRWVRLGQAGDAENQPLPLGGVAVDLPASVDTQRDRDSVRVVEWVINRGDSINRPSHAFGEKTGIVLVGGPGQGKSTISQLICQVYRLALLQDRPAHTLGVEVAELRDRLGADLAQIALPRPALRRWPLRISLSEYGDAIAGGEDVSVLRYVTEQVRRRHSAATGAQMQSWLSEWPWLLVLDGLDEVAAPPVRDQLMRNISDFLVDAAQVDADLLILATTRPQGYSDEFTPSRYEHLTLGSLEPPDAIGYARRLAAARHRDDGSTQQQIVDRVTVATQDSLTARLMRSPLQVTIMSLLLERRPRAPQDRYGLFNAYYETVYSREVAKTGPIARLLDENGMHVHALHERVGLLLQYRAERKGESESVLTESELRRLAVEQLQSEGYEPAASDQLAKRLVDAATLRLVLLVPSTPGHVGFEVRSLQEFMAARALVTGPDEKVLARLSVLAPSAFWRNTWLLAAGRIFAARAHLRADLLTVIQDADTQSMLAAHVAPGASLALDLLDDDVAATTPRYRHVLIKHTAELIGMPPDGRQLVLLADVTLWLAGQDHSARLVFEQAIEEASGAASGAIYTVLYILSKWATKPSPVGAKARQRFEKLSSELTPEQKIVLMGYGGMSTWKVGSQQSDSPPPWTERRSSVKALLTPAIQSDHLEAIDRRALYSLLDSLSALEARWAGTEQMQAARLDDPHSLDVELDALASAGAAEALITTIKRQPPEAQQVAGQLRVLLRIWLSQQAAGPQLVEIMPELDVS